MIIEKGIHSQVSPQITATTAVAGSPSQFGAGSPMVCNKVFTKPDCEFRSSRHIDPTAMGAINMGISSRVRTPRCHRVPPRVNKARANPTTSSMGTFTRNSALSLRAPWKRSSATTEVKLDKPANPCGVGELANDQSMNEMYSEYSSG